MLSKLSTDEHTVGANFVSPSPSDGVESNEFVKAEAGDFFFGEGSVVKLVDSCVIFFTSP